MLYFGSFNPIHKGHIALAEYAIEKGLCDEVVLVVSPQNPLKPAGQQAPELDRFSMAETACAASKYPDKIKPSAIEFMLDKPSYTIHTLRHLTENYGTQMRFSILMGDDLVPQLPERKQYLFPKRTEIPVAVIDILLIYGHRAFSETETPVFFRIQSIILISQNMLFLLLVP